ncbi:MAG: NAD(P)H-binding protein, partial [Candidatus Thorarchaeota archaeon]
MKSRKVLVLGATGYVGQRLVRRLADDGHRVKASWRSITKLNRCSWSKDSRVQPVYVDVLQSDTLQKALHGCSSAYYLIHSMYSGKQYAQLDRDAASNMCALAQKTGLEHIIYLGGLLDRRDRLSKHLLSRAEVSRILQSGPVPVTTLRAAMLLGAGSASFEIMRYVVERLPFMITPRWAQSKTQPIAISNALTYLLNCLTHSETIGKTFDIGGPEIVSYPDLIQIFTQEANLTKRTLLPIPFLGRKLSEFFIDKVTPIPQSLARPLIRGLKSETICRDNRIIKIIPQKLLTNRATIRLALQEINFNLQRSRWAKDPPSFIPEWTEPNDPPWAGGTVYIDHRKAIAKCSPEELWDPVIRIGGPQGWYYANWVWRIYG